MTLTPMGVYLGFGDYLIVGQLPKTQAIKPGCTPFFGHCTRVWDI